MIWVLTFFLLSGKLALVPAARSALQAKRELRAQNWAPGSPTHEGSVGAQMSGLGALLLLPLELLGWGFSPCTPCVPNNAFGERMWREMWC